MSKNITSSTPYGTIKFNSDLVGVDFGDSEKPIFRFSTLNILPIFNIEEYGAIGNDSTFDSSTALQNAIIAANNAGGGRVIIPSKKYYLKNVLNPDQNNCQIYIPSKSISDLGKVTIVIEGEFETGQVPYQGNPGFTQAVMSQTGSQLISTITGSGTIPSVISGLGNIDAFGFNYNTIFLKNFAIVVPWTNNGPTLTAVNGKYWHQTGIDGLAISMSDAPLKITNTLTNECAAILIGLVNGDPPTYVKNTWISGFKYGVICGELTHLDYVVCYNCIYSYTFTKGHYPIIVDNCFALWGTYCLYFPTTTIFDISPGLSRVVINNLFREYYTSGAVWYSSSYFVNDVNNYAVGTLSYHNVQAAVGTDYSEFSKNGGINLLSRRLDSDIPEWSTTGRPILHTIGVKLFGYNTTDNKLEYNNGSTWIQL